jgi:hypothetical protein
MVGLYDDVFAALHRAGVRFVVVGGVAVVLQGHIRTTVDLDLVVDLAADAAEEQELGRVKAELELQNAAVVQKRQDLERIVARYAADKHRWQEISEKKRLARPVATTAAPAK